MVPLIAASKVYVGLEFLPFIFGTILSLLLSIENGQLLILHFYFILLGNLPLSGGRANPSGDTGNSDEEEDDDKDDVQSQGSSASSEDYIIILPECFDTSRPLGESLYSSALSQPSLEKTGEPETGAEDPEGASQPQVCSVSEILTTSQTLAVVPLTPEVVDTSPQTQR